MSFLLACAGVTVEFQFLGWHPRLYLDVGDAVSSSADTGYEFQCITGVKCAVMSSDGFLLWTRSLG